jgi:hypothetical protein
MIPSGDNKNPLLANLPDSTTLKSKLSQLTWSSFGKTELHQAVYSLQQDLKKIWGQVIEIVNHFESFNYQFALGINAMALSTDAHVKLSVESFGSLKAQVEALGQENKEIKELLERQSKYFEQIEQKQNKMLEIEKEALESSDKVLFKLCSLRANLFIDTRAADDDEDEVAITTNFLAELNRTQLPSNTTFDSKVSERTNQLQGRGPTSNLDRSTLASERDHKTRTVKNPFSQTDEADKEKKRAYQQQEPIIRTTKKPENQGQP